MINGKKVNDSFSDELNEHVTKLLVDFETVFNFDFGYTKGYISTLENVTLLDNRIDDCNWSNRDRLKESFFELICFMNENDLFPKLDNPNDQFRTMFYYNYKE